GLGHHRLRRPGRPPPAPPAARTGPRTPPPGRGPRRRLAPPLRGSPGAHRGGPRRAPHRRPHPPPRRPLLPLPPPSHATARRMVIEVRALALRRGKRALLPGIHLGMAPGEFVGVLGPNGAGKSTLLAAICGELPLERGEVLFDGENLRAMSPRERARKLALLPQESSLL